MVSILIVLDVGSPVHIKGCSHFTSPICLNDILTPLEQCVESRPSNEVEHVTQSLQNHAIITQK
jgi:hypothetical protein